MIKSITIFLVGIAIGSSALFVFMSPKIAKLKAEVLKIEAFSECVQGKIMGAGDYSELILLDVVNCADLINQQND